jgi:hypothetical protein
MIGTMMGAVHLLPGMTASRSKAVLQSAGEAVYQDCQFVLRSDTKFAVRFVFDSSTRVSLFTAITVVLIADKMLKINGANYRI